MLGYHDGSWSGADWLAMSGIMVLFWTVFTALVVWAVHAIRSGGRPPDNKRSNGAGPDDILAERYARGEIEEEEFRRRRELLHNTSGSGSQTKSSP